MSFDWHADVVSKVMGQKLLAKTMNSIWEPFNPKKPAANIQKK
jgi:hypothetical protein